MMKKSEQKDMREREKKKLKASPITIEMSIHRELLDYELCFWAL